MPELDSWIAITLRLPVLVAAAAGLAVGVLIVWGVARLRRWRAAGPAEPAGPTAVGEAAGEEQAELVFARDAYLYFIHNVAHEVSNPLQSIQTNLDNMVECRPDEIGRWQQYHHIIAAEIKRLGRLTDNVRTLSRLETPRAPDAREPVNLKAVIEEAIMARAAEAEAKGLALRYVGPQRPARVLGDRDRLLRVILNLVDNSIKYSDSGQITLTIEEGNGRLLVLVADQGMGISDDDLPWVFDLAYRAPAARRSQRQGSGLGLAVVKRIVSQHGGAVGVESHPNQGSIFYFDLPTYNPDA